MKYSAYLIILLLCISCKDKKSTLKEEVVNNATFLKKSMEYNNEAIRAINSDSSYVIHPDDVKIFLENTKKALDEAKKVDVRILEKVKKDYGKIYKEKYIKGLELQIEGYTEPNANKSLKGQILYDEFVNWVQKEGL